ncbi:MAG: 4-aminobutyrate--2-oxoglutarate transaminase [Rhodocyclaceae bacterium]|nr:4-aminobutyrate--2-oxoglutarate transaminase [Rhodocyclaceae bacterium]
MPTIRLQTEVPGPESRKLVARREAAVSRGAAYLTQLAVVSGSGATVTDADGNTLLDFAGGIGTLAVGHTPTDVVAAITEQARQLIHMCSIVASYEPYVAVCEQLNAVAPGDFPKKSVLLNSGAEAVEAAVKYARAYTGRQALIVFEGAYHGRTNLTMAMTSKYALFKSGFGPFAPEVYRLPFPNVYRRPAGVDENAYVDQCIAAFDHALVAQVAPPAVAAVVVETVQGEGGFIPLPPRFAQHLRARCSEHGMLLVLDEVQAGMGRSGRLFAAEHYDLVPDLFVIGKGIAGGLPLSAVTGRAEVLDAAHPGGIGGTYSGNPLACAAARNVIATLASPDFRVRSEALGARMRAHLERLQQAFPQVIGDVRGLGPMLAIELVKDPVSREPDADLTARINRATLERGLITIRAGLYSNCVRFLPPLTLTDDELDEGMAVLHAAFEACVGPAA